MNDVNLSNDEIDSLLDGLDEEDPVLGDPPVVGGEEASVDEQVSIDLDDLDTIGLSETGDSSGSSATPSSSTPSSLESNSSGLDLNDFTEFDLEDTSSDTNVKKVNFGNLSLGKDTNTPSNIDMLLDVPMDITVELGRAVRKVSEILSLNVGAVVELNKLSGEPVELLVNGKVIALAEVVVIDENFGVRITEIVDPQDRVKFE